MSAIRSLASISLLSILLMPSPRIFDSERTHKRHATCEHHLRRHHPDPEERAKIIRRAERRQRQLEEQARLERERAQAEQTGDDAAVLADALSESNLQPSQAAADPQDDDSRMKKKRRPSKIKTLFWLQQEPPKIRTAGTFLAMLRVHLQEERPLVSTAAETLEHYGSGPCHSIPRPREGTVPAIVPCPGAVA
jgi:hypothetical protein